MGRVGGESFGKAGKRYGCGEMPSGESVRKGVGVGKCRANWAAAQSGEDMGRGRW